MNELQVLDGLKASGSWLETVKSGRRSVFEGCAMCIVHGPIPSLPNMCNSAGF